MLLLWLKLHNSLKTTFTRGSLYMQIQMIQNSDHQCYQLCPTLPCFYVLYFWLHQWHHGGSYKYTHCQSFCVRIEVSTNINKKGTILTTLCFDFPLSRYSQLCKGCALIHLTFSGVLIIFSIMTLYQEQEMHRYCSGFIGSAAAIGDK